MSTVKVEPDADETGYVYTLNDPRTGDPKYVGATISPTQRLYQHKGGKTSPQISEWVDELQANGGEPELQIVQEVPRKQMPRVEREVYRELSQNHDLFNNELPQYEIMFGESSEVLLSTDEDILDVFVDGKHRGEPWGLTTKSHLTEVLEYHPNTIYHRTQKLIEWGIIRVENDTSRLFRLVHDPRETSPNQSTTIQDYL